MERYECTGKQERERNINVKRVRTNARKRMLNQCNPKSVYPSPYQKFIFASAFDAGRYSWWDLMVGPAPYGVFKSFIVAPSYLSHANPAEFIYYPYFKEKEYGILIVK